MARLWSCGFELQSVSDGVEYDASDYGSPSISTDIKRSGAASLRLNPTASDYGISHGIGSTENNVFIRFYLYIATAPSDANTALFYTYDTGAGSYDMLYLNTDGSLSLHVYNGSSFTERGTSSALATGEWHEVELSYNLSGTTWYYTAKVNDVTFVNNASEAGGAGIDIDGIAWDIFTFDPVTQANGNATADLYIDDIAVNNTSGSYQNSYPGNGQIVHLKPDAAGDNAPTTGTYADVDEITPDDATSYIQLDANGVIGDFGIESCADGGIPAGSIINVIQVGFRDRAETSTTESKKLRIKGQTAGSVQEGSTKTHNDTTWRTNSDSVPRIYSLTSYLNPQDSQAWETSDIDQAQIGVEAVDASPHIWITTLWALVEYEYLPTEQTVTAKARIQLFTNKQVQAKGNIYRSGQEQSVSAKGQIHMFVELFDSTTYKDSGETDADWDITEGRLRLSGTP